MNRLPNELFFAAGVIFMFIALVMANITFIDGYGSVLPSVLLLMVAADGCFAIVAIRERGGWRTTALVAMLPTLYIVADAMCRMFRIC